MNKIEKQLENYRKTAQKIMELEDDYYMKNKGSIYEMRKLNLRRKLDYYELKIKNLGKESLALVKLTYYDKNNILRTSKFRLVGLNEQEIELLCKTRLPQGYETKRVKYLATGFPE